MENQVCKLFAHRDSALRISDALGKTKEIYQVTSEWTIKSNAIGNVFVPFK